MSAAEDARRAEWARAAAEREAAQKAVQARKEQLVGELRSIANGSSTSWETTMRVKNISGEFYKAGYAGKDVNDALKRRHDEAKADYFRKVEVARKHEDENRARVRREMEHQLFVLERIAYADVRADRWDAWKQASHKFFKAGYPGKDAKADLMKRFGKLREDLSRGLERDRAHKAAQRKSRW